MLPPESSLARTVASFDASSAGRKLSDDARGALHALAEAPCPERAGRALDALRTCGARSVFEEVAGALGHLHRDIVLALALPGARWPAGLDVRTAKPQRYEPDWHGDVFVALPFRVPGAVVSLGTGRGARALASLDDGARAAIVELDLLSGAHAEVDVLAAIAFPRVRRLSPNDAPARGVAALIRCCPALEDCSLGKLVAPEVLDALADAASLVSTYLDGPRDAELVRLAALPRLAEVILGRSPSQPEFGAAGLSALARGGPLRSLSVSYARVDDAELSVIAEQTALEALFAARGS